MLPYLLRAPHLTRHIRKLAVRPNYYLAWPKPDAPPINEDLVADLVVRLAEAGRLEELRTFDWDGLEMPKDAVWAVLASHCLELKTVFCNVGFGDVSHDSAVSGFFVFVFF